MIRGAGEVAYEWPEIASWRIPGGRQTTTHLIAGEHTKCGRLVPASARRFQHTVVLCLRCEP